MSTRLVWRLVPIPDRPMHEHTPLDYARYGEYPRFINPPGWMQPKTEWKLIEVDAPVSGPAELPDLCHVCGEKTDLWDPNKLYDEFDRPVCTECNEWLIKQAKETDDDNH